MYSIPGYAPLTTMNKTTDHPVEKIRHAFTNARGQGPRVITAPTGSGKSTQIPRWCALDGRVLVIEPRRVACRSLAHWVAELNETALGEGVGYSVRGESRLGPDTQILFATPGVVIRWLARGHPLDFQTVILDEFHERGLDVDLLLALLGECFLGEVVVMSATLQATRIARHLGGVHLEAEGRTFPVDITYVPGNTLLPDIRGLEERLLKAVQVAEGRRGDILVFLPGKAEISKMADKFRNDRHFDAHQMHGGLTLKEQSRIFTTNSQKRRIIFATNVAETSITIPGIGVVIDSGLVRRTRYINGRGFLTLLPVAEDSADQRAGRAGRTGPGACYRLWDSKALLDKVTPPEIHRESLLPLVIAAAACGHRAAALPFLDPPKSYALAAAEEELHDLGALDKTGTITPRGEQIFGLPLDATLGNLLIEARAAGCIEEAIDVVSALAVGRPLFISDKRPIDEEDDLRAKGCDASATIRAIRQGNPARHGLSGFVLNEAKSIRRRLRSAWGLETSPADGAPLPLRLKQLARAALRADRRSAYVARHRRGRVFFGNGGTEISLARESAIQEDQVAAIAVLGSMAVEKGYKNQNIYATCAMPISFSDLAEEGFGETSIRHATRDGSRVVATLETTYAGKIIATREDVPKGDLAASAFSALFLRRKLFPSSLEITSRRLEAAALFVALGKAGHPLGKWEGGDWNNADQVPTLEQWAKNRFVVLGVSSGEDLPLLSENDLIAPPLPPSTQEELDREFPREIKLGDADYAVSYDLKKSEATLDQLRGNRKTPPSLSLLPSFSGFRVRVRHHSKIWVIRDR